MLLSFRNLVLSSTALCTTAAFAADQKRVQVPFSFVAKSHVYQAGAYTVAIDWTRSVVTLTEIGMPSQQLRWIVVPGATASGHPEASLTFNVSGHDHVLRTIQYAAFATPNLDPKPKQRSQGFTTVGE